jgi:type I restriction enzyme S subunit
MITSAYTVCEPLGGCNYAYLESYLITLDDKKLLAPLYSGLRNTIPKGRFLGMKVPVPPVSEQAAIVAHLDTATRDLDATIARTQRQIDLLREYRARLVADVVTGKLDVRAAAAALPDEAPDDGEPLAPDDDDAADDDVDATDAPDEG